MSRISMASQASLQPETTSSTARRRTSFRRFRYIVAAWALAVAAGCSSGSGGTSDAIPPNDAGPTGDGGPAINTIKPLAVWSQAAALPGTPVAYSRAVTVGQQIFVVGGRTVNLPDKPGAAALGVYAYDPLTAQWEEHTSLPQGIDQPNVAAVGDKIYVLGGTGIAQTFIYDTTTRAWAEKDARPGTVGIGAAALAVAGNAIYVAGGQVPNLVNPRGKRVTHFASYDTVKGTWETLPPLPEESAYFGAAIVDDVLFTVGGSTEQREVARPGKTFAFSLTTRTWSERAVAPDAVSSYASAAAGGLVYIIGGIAGATGRINPETQVYDPTTDSWSTTAPLTPSRFAMGAAVLDGKIYVPGGVMQLGESEFVPVTTVDVLGP